MPPYDNLHVIASIHASIGTPNIFIGKIDIMLSEKSLCFDHFFTGGFFCVDFLENEIA